MKIGIDGIALTIKFPCGTKHYAEGLLRALAKIDKKNTYYVFSAKPIDIPVQMNFFWKPIPDYFPYLKRQVFFPKCILREKVDIFHYLHPYGAIFFRHPKIITTVHDTDLDKIFPIFSHFKYFFQRYYCEVTRNGVFFNTHSFITISNTIKKELEVLLRKKNMDKPIKVIPEGVDEDFKIKKNVKRCFKSKYILCIADYSKRKNIQRILQSYVNLGNNIKDKVGIKIIISTEFPKNSILKLAEYYQVNDKVDIIQNISKSGLIDLYNNAYCFLYPSLYEGFGLPVLEAMACGCPVVTSRGTATEEVAGSAAILVNPYSAEEISSAMKLIVNDNKLRLELIKKGLDRVKQFAWEKTARKTLEIYNKVNLCSK